MVDVKTLLQQVCPPLDTTLAQQLLKEYISQQKRYRLRDWEPGTLDGGQFAECAARIVYHQDSGNLNRQKGVDSCLKYVETETNPHQFPEPKSARHIARAIRLIYKFRSTRGAIHISDTYDANHLDARLVMDCSRWVLSEILRIFWSGDREEVARVIREIVRYEVPAIREFDGRPLVQRTDLTTEEEILLLLYRAGEEGLAQARVAKCTPKDASRVSRGLKALRSNKRREITQLDNGNFVLTDIGCKRVLEELGDKRFPE